MQNFIGVIDVIHVAAWAPSSNQMSFQGRKVKQYNFKLLISNILLHYVVIDYFYVVSSGYLYLKGFLAT